jgi:hypothetical protein
LDDHNFFQKMFFMLNADTNFQIRNVSNGSRANANIPFVGIWAANDLLVRHWFHPTFCDSRD